MSFSHRTAGQEAFNELKVFLEELGVATEEFVGNNAIAQAFGAEYNRSQVSRYSGTRIPLLGG